MQDIKNKKYDGGSGSDVDEITYEVAKGDHMSCESGEDTDIDEKKIERANYE